ncbi:MAG: hypothetical protein WC435_00270 [Candidatus Paceibacterota bacterium]
MITGATEKQFQSNIERIVKEKERESREWKKITLGILASFLALGFSYFFYGFLSKAEGDFLLALLFFSLFSVTFLLSAVLIEDQKTLYAFVFIESVMASVFFIAEADFMWSSAAFCILFIFLSWAIFSGKREEEAYLRIKFFRTGRAVMLKFVTGMSFFAAIAYVAVVLSGSVNLISKETLYSLMTPSVSFINKFYPGFSLDQTLRENIEIMVSKEVEKSSSAAIVSEEEKRAIITSGVIKTENTFSDFLGMSLNSRDKTSDVLHLIVSLKFSELFNQYGYGVYVVLALIVFLVIRGIGPLFYWPVLVSSFVIYEFLRALGFFAILLEERSKEVIYMK